MGKFIDLTGQRFERLVVANRVGTAASGSALWRCICDCGKETNVSSNALRSGATLSCGCLGVEKRARSAYRHGGTGTRLYRIWDGMINRCHRKTSRNYANYGGRGITVCEEWRKDFSEFMRWALANGYRDDLTLERKDNDIGYCPENCCWITFKDQQNHKRDNHLITYKGETHNIAEWSEITGIYFGTIASRVKLGWDAEAIFSTPVQKQRTITFNGETHTVSEWSEITGIKKHTIHSRMRNGWPVERLFDQPTPATGKHKGRD